MAHAPRESLIDTGTAVVPLPAAPWAAIRVQGRDARGFLQGQLTQDLRTLTPVAGLRAALCTAQGRVIACTWLVETTPAAGEPGVWILLPDELADTVAAVLRRYVLRAKLTISTTHGHAAARAWLADDATVLDAIFPDDAARDGVLAVCRRAGRTWLRAGAKRVLEIPDDAATPADGAAPFADLRPADAPSFELAAIRDGEPMVFAATSGHWVAQMLNLDLIDGISFSKGCYTGQEIVTRTQHRGQIKRRMLCFAVRGVEPPAPGSALLSATGRAGEVVRSAADGADAELLAVVPLEQADTALRLENGAAQRRRCSTSSHSER